METILDSIRVVEMTEALAGPYCAMLLGDFGADVIKVERPGVGDQSRGWGPPFVGSESAYYLAANRNKRSITLNYDHPRGAEAWLETLAKADIPAAPINTVAGAIENPQTRAGLDCAARTPRDRHGKEHRKPHPLFKHAGKLSNATAVAR